MAQTFIRASLSFDAATIKRIDDLVAHTKLDRSKVVRKAIAELWVRLVSPETNVTLD